MLQSESTVTNMYATSSTNDSSVLLTDVYFVASLQNVGSGNDFSLKISSLNDLCAKLI